MYPIFLHIVDKFISDIIVFWKSYSVSKENCHISFLHILPVLLRIS